MANYINTLQAENAALKAEIEAKNELIRDLRAHLASSKFWNDTTIQVGDVDKWLVAIQFANGEG